MPIAWKGVHCLDPEAASRLGVPAETPVFVSSIVRRADTCPGCGAVYTPLVYAPGHVTRAQHRVPPPACPGIYHVHGPLRAGPTGLWQGPMLRLHSVLLAGEVTCTGYGICELSPTFRGLALYLRCTDSLHQRRARESPTNGRWYWRRLPLATRHLAPLCEACAAHSGPLEPWVLLLRRGQPSWRWEPDGKEVPSAEARVR